MISRAFYGIFWGSVVYTFVTSLYLLFISKVGVAEAEKYSLFIDMTLILVDIFLIYCLYRVSSFGKNFSRAFWIYLTLNILEFLDTLISTLTAMQSDTLYNYIVICVFFIFNLASVLFLCNGIIASAKEHQLRELAEAASYRRNRLFGSIVIMLVSFLLGSLIGQIHPLVYILVSIVYLSASLMFLVSSILILFLYRKTALLFKQVEQAF